MLWWKICAHFFFYIRVASIPKHLCFYPWPWSMQGSGLAWEPPSEHNSCHHDGCTRDLWSERPPPWQLKHGPLTYFSMAEAQKGTGFTHAHTLMSYRGTETSGKCPLITQESKLSPTIWGTVCICVDFQHQAIPALWHSLCLELLRQNRQAMYSFLFSLLGMFGKRKLLSPPARHTMPNHRHQYLLSLFLKLHSTCTFHFFHNTATGFSYFLKS